MFTLTSEQALLKCQTIKTLNDTNIFTDKKTSFAQSKTTNDDFSPIKFHRSRCRLADYCLPILERLSRSVRSVKNLYTRVIKVCFVPVIYFQTEFFTVCEHEYK